MWTVEIEYIIEWLDGLDAETIAKIFAALKRLEQEGPHLGRPLADTLSGSRVKNLKELRPASPRGSEIRIIFAFDPLRNAVMLLGGDKAKGKSGKTKWSEWYKRAIPKAETLYFDHLEKLKEQE